MPSATSFCPTPSKLPGRVDQIEQSVLEFLSQYVRDIIFWIFGPREPYLADLQAGKICGIQTIDMVLVLVRHDGEIDETAGHGDDIGANFLRRGRR
jgi:hypothetical protein